MTYCALSNHSTFLPSSNKKRKYLIPIITDNIKDNHNFGGFFSNPNEKMAIHGLQKGKIPIGIIILTTAIFFIEQAV